MFCHIYFLIVCIFLFLELQLCEGVEAAVFYIFISHFAAQFYHLFINFFVGAAVNRLVLSVIVIDASPASSVFSSVNALSVSCHNSFLLADGSDGIKKFSIFGQFNRRICYDPQYYRPFPRQFLYDCVNSGQLYKYPVLIIL